MCLLVQTFLNSHSHPLLSDLGLIVAHVQRSEDGFNLPLLAGFLLMRCSVQDVIGLAFPGNRHGSQELKRFHPCYAEFSFSTNRTYRVTVRLIKKSVNPVNIQLCKNSLFQRPLNTQTGKYFSGCTDYGLKDDNRDNFILLWNIGKIFGMLEDLIVNNKATRHFLFM